MNSFNFQLTIITLTRSCIVISRGSLAYQVLFCASYVTQRLTLNPNLLCNLMQETLIWETKLRTQIKRHVCCQTATLVILCSFVNMRVKLNQNAPSKSNPFRILQRQRHRNKNIHINVKCIYYIELPVPVIYWWWDYWTCGSLILMLYCWVDQSLTVRHIPIIFFVFKSLTWNVAMAF